MKMRMTTRWFSLAAASASLILALAQKTSAVSATGGTVANVGAYRIHTFTNSGSATSLVVTAGGNVDVLVVAGGGGGGQTIGGGGGAGGFITNAAYAVTAGTYQVTVGVGGAGAPGDAATYATNGASKGSNSIFNSLMAYGGGGGGSYNQTANGATAGGSGGGTGAGLTSGGPMAGTNGQGKVGGTTAANANSGGGGGGAGAAGSNAVSGTEGAGGAGLSSDISGASGFYAGGGGGGARDVGGNGGAGGNGGGGAGRRTIGFNALANTGGGGGGGGYLNALATSYAGGNGGSGIVIVRYIAGSPLISNTSALVTGSAVTLSGYLVSTGMDGNVSAAVFWGTNDAGSDKTGWTYTNWFPGWSAVGSLSTNVPLGSPGGTRYYFRFFASNSWGSAWAQPSGSFSSTGAPGVNIAGGAVNVGPFSATLQGEVTGGYPTPEVWIYWGATNQGATKSWEHQIPFGPASNWTFSATPNGMSPGRTYYYICYASNSYGDAWSAVTNFTCLGGMARTWDGGGANALASNPTNWDGNLAPGPGDTIILNATTNKNMTWDLNIPLASWTQAGYAGTVTLAPGGGGTNLTIVGDCVISNGILQFTAGQACSLIVNGNMYVNSRIVCPWASAISGNGTGRVFTVGGNLTVDTGGKFDGDKLGFAYNSGPGEPPSWAFGYCAAGHGGQGGCYSTWTPGPTYGSVTNPVTLGSGATFNNGGGAENGGGAIKLDIAGQMVLNGVVSVNGGYGGTGIGSGGSGGSILILADSIAGSGLVMANGGAAGGTANTSGGGGGRIAVVRRTGSGFGSIGLQAYGGTNNTAGKGAAGTIYLKQATEDYGRLVVDNSNNVTTATTLLSTNVSDTVVGDVIIRNGGILAVAASQTLAVYGGWSNGASFTAASGSTVLLAGTNEATLYGSTTFDVLACTNGGKRLNFQAGTTSSVQGVLTLKGVVNGSVTNTLVLRSTSASAWKLNMAAGKPQNVQYVDVQYSDARGGTAIEAYDSVDSGNNSNWVFGAAGQTNIWTGAISTNWGVSGNWSLLRATVPADVVLIPGGCPRYPTLDNIKTVAALGMSNAASLRLVGYKLTIMGNATLAGSLIPSGTETITFSGDLDFTGGAFTQGTARVVIGGASAQTITSGAIIFNSLVVTNTLGTVTFADALTVSSFTNYSGNLGFATNATMTDFRMFTTGSVTVAAGAVWAVTNLSIQGASAGKIGLRSAAPGTRWKLNVQNWSSVAYVDAQDSDATPGLGIYPILSSDSGNNTNWFFGDSGNWKRWNGSVSESFTNGSNWTPAGAPDSNTLALVDGVNYTNAPRLTNALTIRALTVGGISSAVVTVDAPLTVREDLTVLQKGTITHSPSGSTPLYMLDLIVGSNLYLEGSLDVDGQGYRGNCVGPGAGNVNIGAVHGGRVSNNGNLPYGSIIAPTNLGSTAYSYAGTAARGGGAIRAVVSQAIVFINGIMTANAKTLAGSSGWGGSAGGSVFLTAGRLTGRGAIRANGDDGAGCGTAWAGSGGRISVVLSNGNDFGAVAMETIGGYPAANSPCGTIYLQTAAQGPGRGTLVIDNKNIALDATTCAMIAPSVTGTTVGDVVIRNSGALRVGANLSLTVNGSLSNGPAFTADAGSTVYLAGTNEATLYGSWTFQGLVCTNGGKRINFAAGSTYVVSNALTLRGAATNAGSTLVLRSTASSNWYLTMSAGKPLDVQYVDVQYSNAKNGTPITAYDSVDNSFNTNWIFGSAGQTNAWNGSVDTNWGTAANWSLGRATLPSDIVLIPGGCPWYPVLDTIKIIGSLMISNGASLRLGGYGLTIPGNATLAGLLIPSGTETITFSGNLDFTGGVFSQGNTRVVINGTNTQMITSGGIAYNIVIVTNTAGTLTFTQATIANAFTNQGRSLVFAGPVSVSSFMNYGGNLGFATNVTMTSFDMYTTGSVTVAAGAMWSVTNLSIQGTPAGKIRLRSAGPGTNWLLNVRNWSSLAYVDAQDSDATPGLGIYPILSTDSGNNPNWFFGESAGWKRWNGSVSTSFTNGSNWSPAGAPDSNTLVLVDGLYTNAPRLTNALIIRALTVGGVSSAVVTVDALLTVREDVNVLQKGAITHSANSTIQVYMLDLIVGSNLYLEGSLDADGQGYRGCNIGPGAGGIAFGALHGGYISNNGKQPYGSITAPTNLGSTAFTYTADYARGGGAIRAVVGNRTALVNGNITANAKASPYVSGFGGCAGGSVFLTTGSLTGNGIIRANGDDLAGTALAQSGSGGRVAVILTRSNDFGAVTIEAAGVYGCTISPCGTVYLQTAAQGPGRGTLVIDNKNQALDAVSCTMIGPSVTDAVVGDVVIRNGGYLAIFANQYLTVNGSWSNGARFASYGGSTVEFAGADPALILSANTFCNFKSTAGGKRLTFEAGKTNAVTNSLVLLRTTIDSTVPGSYAYLRLSAGATQDVQRVTVRDNNATNGQTILATKSVDLGHNVNWNIIAAPAGTFLILH